MQTQRRREPRSWRYIRDCESRLRICRGAVPSSQPLAGCCFHAAAAFSQKLLLLRKNAESRKTTDFTLKITQKNKIQQNNEITQTQWYYAHKS